MCQSLLDDAALQALDTDDAASSSDGGDADDQVGCFPVPQPGVSQLMHDPL